MLGLGLGLGLQLELSLGRSRKCCEAGSDSGHLGSRHLDPLMLVGDHEKRDESEATGCGSET